VEAWQLIGGVLAALTLVTAMEFAAPRCARLGDWLRGRAARPARPRPRPREPRDRPPKNREPKGETPGQKRAARCPVCGGRPGGTPGGGAHPGGEIALCVEVFSAPCLDCDGVKRYHCCPICSGAGEIPWVVARDYLARGEPALEDYRRAARGN
jgi:hypothetical protein